MATRTQSKRTGQAAYDCNDPRWFPTAQGEAFAGIIIWMLNQLPEMERTQFVEGAATLVARRLQAIQAAPSAAEQTTAPVPKKRRARKEG